MKKATIYDISQALNISASTVSRALNDSSSVTQKTKDKILKAARELNYYHNKTAAKLKSGRSYTVGIIVPFIHHHVFSGVIQSIEETLAPLGYTVVICQTYEKLEFEINHVQNLLANQVECIFIAATKETTGYKHFAQALETNIPLILFDRKIDMDGISSVTIDNFDAAYQATQHLIQQGCKRIGHFLGDQNLHKYRERLAGYSKALADYGLHPHKDWIRRCNSTMDEGKKVFRQIWNPANPIDGLFAPDDLNLLGAYLEIKSLHLKVPDDIALAGFSNEIFTQYSEIPFTTIFQDPLKIGKKMADMFLAQVDNNSNISVTEQTLIKPKLIVRASSLKNEKK